MLRTVIIDDEAHVRETLTQLVKEFCPQVQLVGEAFSVESGVKTIRELHPHLVLLDIRMGDGSAFDLLKKFETIDFGIIFITAYEKYAVQAFRFAAVDFLLKPVNPIDLAHAVKRAESTVQNQLKTQLQTLEENMKSDIRQKKKIVLKTIENIYLVSLQDITHLESGRSYTTVYTLKGERIVISKPLKDFDELLYDDGFYRVHKSYLVNMMHIQRFEKLEGGNIVLTNNHKIPVASRKRYELLDLFDKL
jgi:two-component system LytT family response regulator